MIIPVLHSGLGNQLFQLASMYSFTRQANVRFGISKSVLMRSSHTNINYADTIFKTFVNKYEVSDSIGNVIGFDVNDPNYRDEQVLHAIRTTHSLPNQGKEIVVGLDGYFQNEPVFRGYRQEVYSLLNWGNSSAVVKERYGDLTNGFFLHFRRGDYVGTTFERQLDDYYKEVIARVLAYNPNTRFYIVSDEIEYCKKLPYLSNTGLDCVYVDGLNEIETLWLMSKCPLGGAAPNSTYSWWGLYLNTDRPLLFVSKYYAEHRYGFPGFTFL